MNRRPAALSAVSPEPVVPLQHGQPAEVASRAWQNSSRPDNVPLVIIGSSTGGPQALDQLFSDLPLVLPAAFIIVQHMPPLFTKSLAARLNRRTEMDVREVDEGDPVKCGTVLVGQGGFHVTLGKDKRFHVDQTPPLHGVRPAVDRLLLSVAENWQGKCLVTIMTGMGSDGTSGARALHAKGVEILAQDESTSIVYVMPRSVVDAGLVKAVHPLDKLGQAIEQWIRDTVDVSTNASSKLVEQHGDNNV
jgi:two-component system chemotaxis response regulator CheB